MGERDGKMLLPLSIPRPRRGRGQGEGALRERHSVRAMHSRSKNLWRAFLAQLNEQQRVRWDECFADGTFIAAKKRGAKAGKTKRGKGTKLMVLADGEGLSSARTRGFRTSDAFMFAMSG